MPCDAQNSIGARLTNKLAHTHTHANIHSVCITTLNASQTQAIRAASVPNGAVYQGNYNTNRVGGGEAGEGAEDRYETSGGGTAWKMRKH